MLIALLALTVTVLSPAVATGSAHTETVASFSFDAGELPEGVTVDKKGNVFFPYSPLGQLWKLPKKGGSPELFGQIAGLQPGDLGILGLTVDRKGNVFAGVGSMNPDVNGVWMFHRKTGASTRLPGTEGIGLPNDVAFDRHGNLYITDSPGGAVYVVRPGGDVELFAESLLLQGTGDLGVGIPIGANGIEVHKETVYVAVTEQASIVTIPINKDGSAGEPAVYHQGPQLFGIDGIAVARKGNVYAAVIAQSTVVRVNTDKSVDVIATVDDGLDWPSSLAFGTNKNDKSIYVVNYGIGPLFGAPEIWGPGLVKIAADEKGAKVPG